MEFAHEHRPVESPVASPGNSSIRRGESHAADPHQAVTELVTQIDQVDLAGVVVFCSDAYDPDSLATALAPAFDAPVIGCTTAGEIGTRYSTGGLVGVSFGRRDFRFHPVFLPDLQGFTPVAAADTVASLRTRLELAEQLDPGRMFVISLLDGLSVREEQVTAFLHAAFDGVQLVGGSAGDNLQFAETRVYADGRFHTGSGVMALIETTLPFRTFQVQHFEPSDHDLVITEADPTIRRVNEADGGPAAEEYAALLGLDADNLTPQAFSRYPLMLQIGDEWYVRSIQKANADGSLDFYCAIEEGLPLTVARGVGLVESLERKIDELQADLGIIQCTLGCDCILRRLEIQSTGQTEAVERVLQQINFVGFSTFGEQYGAIHVNQTLTGVALGVT